MQVGCRSIHVPCSSSRICHPTAGGLCKSQERHSLSAVVPRMQKLHNFIASDFKYFICYKTKIWQNNFQSRFKGKITLLFYVLGNVTLNDSHECDNPFFNKQMKTQFFQGIAFSTAVLEKLKLGVGMQHKSKSLPPTTYGPKV